MQPSPMFLETLKQGITKQIDVGAISGKEIKFYSREFSPLKEIYRTFGYCNLISITNMALTINLMLNLDGAKARSTLIPGGAVITLSDVQFTEFSIENVTGNVSLGGEVFITVAYQPPVQAGVSIAGLR